MPARKPVLRLAAAVTATGAVALGATGAPARTGGETPRITPRGVGDVELEARHTALRAAGLVGRRRPGCPLAGGDQKVAKLRAPLLGSVDYGASSPSRVQRISILGGATARGVGVGNRLKAVKAAFPRHKVVELPEFGIRLVRIPRTGGGRMVFVVSASSRKVTEIAVPRIRICD